MPLTNRRLSAILATCCSLALPAATFAAQDAYGVLSVSMTVLSSCEASANGDLALPGVAPLSTTFAADVNCPLAVPYHASIDADAKTGLIQPNNNSGTVFAGPQHLQLSQPVLPGSSKTHAAAPESAIARPASVASLHPVMLTISY